MSKDLTLENDVACTIAQNLCFDYKFEYYNIFLFF